jgi:ribosome maturation factor RimP
MDLRLKIEELAAPFLHAIGAFIVDFQVVSQGERKLIQIFLDTDTGITIGQCSEISRSLSAALELQQVIPGSYVLEVSSPDLKKPLVVLRQYTKNVGRQFKVRYRKDNGVEEILAKLISVQENSLLFITGKDETYTIPFNQIIESIEELPW